MFCRFMDEKWQLEWKLDDLELIYEKLKKSRRELALRKIHLYRKSVP